MSATTPSVIVGIVGSEEIKFTPDSKQRAQALIRHILSDPDVVEVVSGACHLGGIDVWAAEIGKELGLVVTEYPPKNRYWDTGYKPRNMQIARRSNVVHCITVDRLPETYVGMTFDLCYHCNTKDHVKSGGCWTMKQAIKMGKLGILHVVKQENYAISASI
jgi:hypothetical protein